MGKRVRTEEVGTRIGPFFVYPEDRADAAREIADAVLIEFAETTEGDWLVLPQFEIEVPVEDDDTGSEFLEVVHRLTAFYSGLRELPPNFVNEVEQMQLEILEKEFLPWLVRTLGKAPEGYWTLPMDALQGAGRLDLASA